MDENVKIFVVEFYELLHNCSEEMKNIYADNAELHIYNRNTPGQVIKNNFEKAIPLGKRKITKYSGSVIDAKMFVHVQSELEQPYNKMVVDESFVCSLTKASILINYQSIHINPLIEPIEEKKVEVAKPKQMQKQAQETQKEAKKAVEVKSIDDLKTVKCVLVLNLPFKEKPSEFLPQLEMHGNIIKYCETKGKLLAEFEKIEDMFKAKDAKYPAWKGRQPKVIRCPKQFTF